MDRSEFLKFLGVGSALAFIPSSVKGTKEEKIVTKDAESDYEELYQIVKEGKPVNIGGIEFYITEMNVNHQNESVEGRIMDGRRAITLSLSG